MSDDLQGLDKHGLTGLRGAVDHADAALVVLLDRDDVSPSALGDVAVLEHRRHRAAADEVVEDAVDASGEVRDPVAEIGELRVQGLRELPGIVEAAL